MLREMVGRKRARETEKEIEGGRDRVMDRETERKR